MEESTQALRDVVRNLEDDADAVTALALFPLKSIDKKVAFVVGLVRENQQRFISLINHSSVF